jgi:hypothetical protein
MSSWLLHKGMAAAGLIAELVAEDIVGVGRLQLDAARRIVAVTITNAC